MGVLNNIYKQTPVQANFGANMLALVKGEPQLLTLKNFLTVFISFRVETIIRRSKYELRKAEERNHLLQGLLIALDSLDAIMQMQLRRLTALEAEKIHAEHKELQIKIANLNDILSKKERIEAIIEEELVQIKNIHGTPRCTEIIHDEGEIVDTDLIANEQAIILLTEQGYIKRMPVSSFDAQQRATRGKAGAKIKENDVVEHFLTCCDHDVVLLFSDRGVVYATNAYQIPSSSRTSRGVPIVQMLSISKSEKITSIISVSEFKEDIFLVMLTRQGYIKKTALSAFSNIRTNGLIAISLGEGDQLRWVRLTREEDSVIL